MVRAAETRSRCETGKKGSKTTRQFRIPGWSGWRGRRNADRHPQKLAEANAWRKMAAGVKRIDKRRMEELTGEFGMKQMRPWNLVRNRLKWAAEMGGLHEYGNGRVLGKDGDGQERCRRLAETIVKRDH